MIALVILYCIVSLLIGLGWADTESQTGFLSKNKVKKYLFLCYVVIGVAIFWPMIWGSILHDNS